jgi:hypothetical protein
VGDLTVEQCLLQFGHARIGDPGAFEAKLPEAGHAFEVRQPSAGDVGVAEIEILPTRQPLEVNEPSAGYLRTKGERVETGVKLTTTPLLLRAFHCEH